MKRVIATVCLLTLVSCGGGAAIDPLLTDGDPSNDPMTLYDVFEYSPNNSTCAPGSIYEELLSGYVNEAFTYFAIYTADNELDISGELNDDLVYSFTSAIEDEEADCYMQFQTWGDSVRLYQTCQSESYDCETYWYPQ
jgi:hypothetical protein